MDEKITGGMSLWDRIINDPEFLEMREAIQKRYGLPLNYDIRLHVTKWNKWKGGGKKKTGRTAKRGRAFFKDMNALFKKLEVPGSWHNDLIAEIAGTPSDDSRATRGYPVFDIYQAVDGSFQWRCIIDPETDLTNPLILKAIQEQQKKYAGDPPAPVKTNTARKLDWRPVYDWHKRHPLFSLEEIAKKIGYPKAKVKLKIAELEGKK